MIEKFFEKFQEFASHEDRGELSDEATAILFGVYLQALRPVQPSVPAPESEPANQRVPAPAPVQSKIRKPNRPATAKQENFIRTLVRQGKLPSDTDATCLTVGEASSLIEVGVKAQPNSAPSPAPTPAPKPAPVVKAEPSPEPEPGTEFTGSYTHASGGSTSSAFFWE